jgi:hypothetical protein
MSEEIDFETLNPILSLVLILVSLLMGIFPALVQLGLLVS